VRTKTNATIPFEEFEAGMAATLDIKPQQAVMGAYTAVSAPEFTGNVYKCKNLSLSGGKLHTIWQIFSPNLYRSSRIIMLNKWITYPCESGTAL
jgi:hypothetical protein